MSLQLSGGTIVNITGRTTWQSALLHPFWFDTTTPLATLRVTGSTGNAQIAVGDKLYRRDYGDPAVTDYTWNYTIAPGRTGAVETISRFSSNSGVIIPNTGDVSNWVWKSNGSATITLASSSGTRTVNASVITITTGSYSIDTYLGYDPASLRQTIITGVDNRIAGKTAAAALRILSTYDNTTPNYVRNTGCWAYDVDLTSMSPWNSDGGFYKAGILVSPRHILFATHYPIATGSTIRFVAKDNTLVTRTMTGSASLPGYVPYYPDCTIGMLDSDVPASISFAKVLPDNYTSKLPGSVWQVPAITLDQEEKALVTDIYLITATSGMYGAMVYYVQPADHQRTLFYEDKVGGDSGNPACIIVNGQIVVLNVWTFGGPGQGTNLVYWKTGINALMSSLGGGYQLTEIDLSTYPSYS